MRTCQGLKLGQEACFRRPSRTHSRENLDTEYASCNKYLAFTPHSSEARWHTPLGRNKHFLSHNTATAQPLPIERLCGPGAYLFGLHDSHGVEAVMETCQRGVSRLCAYVCKPADDNPLPSLSPSPSLWLLTLRDHNNGTSVRCPSLQSMAHSLRAHPRRSVLHTLGHLRPNTPPIGQRPRTILGVNLANMAHVAPPQRRH